MVPGVEYFCCPEHREHTLCRCEAQKNKYKQQLSNKLHKRIRKYKNLRVALVLCP